jgi:probable phosphoglycerate mutase
MNQALPLVYLVRHADTAWTLTGQHTGRSDLPLTEHALNGRGTATASAR